MLIDIDKFVCSTNDSISILSKIQSYLEHIQNNVANIGKLCGANMYLMIQSLLIYKYTRFFLFGVVDINGFIVRRKENDKMKEMDSEQI